MLNAESLNAPISWSNLNFVNYDINFMVLLGIVLASTITYLLLTIYAWPLRQVKDGRKIGCCYCCSSDYYKHRGDVADDLS